MRLMAGWARPRPPRNTTIVPAASLVQRLATCSLRSCPRATGGRPGPARASNRRPPASRSPGTRSTPKPAASVTRPGRLDLPTISSGVGPRRREHRRIAAHERRAAVPRPARSDAGILRGLMSEISEEDARWKPAPDRFSIAEVLAHLSHSEGTATARGSTGSWPRRRRSSSRTTRRCISICTRTPTRRRTSGTSRTSGKTNIELLRGLPAETGGRKAMHPVGGRDHALADAARVGAARSRARPADRGAGAGAEVPGGRGPLGRGLSVEAMTIRRLFARLASRARSRRRRSFRCPTRSSGCHQERGLRARDRELRVRDRERESAEARIRLITGATRVSQGLDLSVAHGDRESVPS